MTALSYSVADEEGAVFKGDFHMFKFDLSKGSCDNIADFWSHLESLHPTFASLLKENVGALVPLPENNQSKSDKRAEINGKVAAALDKLAASEGGAD